MNQGTKIVAVVLFVLFTGTAIYYVTLSPAKPASPTAPKAAETPAKAPDKPVDQGPGSITMNPPGAPVAAPAGPRIVDPLASGSTSTPTPAAGATPSGPAASSPTAPTSSPRITLGPGGTPSAVMPPLNVTRSTPPAVPVAGTSGGVTGETASTASPVRPTTPVAATSPSSTTPASSGTSSAREHVVASGDTLSSIAARYLGSENRWEEIAKANPGINPNSMRVGTKLSIPAGLAIPAGAASSPLKPAATASGGEYVVKAGDTLTAIARQTLGNADWEAIYEANRSVIGPNPAALRVGMKLAIPKRS